MESPSCGEFHTICLRRRKEKLQLLVIVMRVLLYLCDRQEKCEKKAKDLLQTSILYQSFSFCLVFSTLPDKSTPTNFRANLLDQVFRF